MIQNHADGNNDKKFIFISQANVVDYRENGENGYISPNQATTKTQQLNQRNHSLSNSNSFNNVIHHSSSHSSLSNGSSNSYHNHMNNVQNNSYNSYSSGRNNSNRNSYHNSPYIENLSNLNNLNGKWNNKETADYLVDDELTDQKSSSSPRKRSNQKLFYNDNHSFECNDNGELNELDEVRKQIANGRLTRGSTGLLIFEDAIPKKYDDVSIGFAKLIYIFF